MGNWNMIADNKKELQTLVQTDHTNFKDVVALKGNRGKEIKITMKSKQSTQFSFKSGKAQDGGGQTHHRYYLN